jgi:carboxylesterase
MISEEKQKMKNPYLISSAEPFFLPGGKVGILLTHGFTGTPKEMRWMGEYLNNKGFTVLGIRLFGHATQPDDMLRARWWDWVANVEDGLNMLKSFTTYQCMAGLSMGGALTLIAASYASIKCAVAISTPCCLPPDPRLMFLKILPLFYPKVPKGESDFHNNIAKRDHIEYPYFPTRALQELRTLIKEMVQGLSKVTIPVLLIQSRNDHTIPPQSMDVIFEQLGTKKKEKLWVEDSGHVVVREPDREIAFKATYQFVSRYTGK